MSTGMTVSGISGVTQQEATSTLCKTCSLAAGAAGVSLLSSIGRDTYNFSNITSESFWGTFKSLIKDGSLWKQWGATAGIAAAVVGGGYLLCKGISGMLSKKD